MRSLLVWVGALVVGSGIASVAVACAPPAPDALTSDDDELTSRRSKDEGADETEGAADRASSTSAPASTGSPGAEPSPSPSPSSDASAPADASMPADAAPDATKPAPPPPGPGPFCQALGSCCVHLVGLRKIGCITTANARDENACANALLECNGGGGGGGDGP